MSDTPKIDGIREFQWPFRNPLDLVAELFCACRWQIGEEEAAIFAANYLFAELRLRIGQDEAKKYSPMLPAKRAPLRSSTISRCF